MFKTYIPLPTFLVFIIVPFTIWSYIIQTSIVAIYLKSNDTKICHFYHMFMVFTKTCLELLSLRQKQLSQIACGTVINFCLLFPLIKLPTLDVYSWPMISLVESQQQCCKLFHSDQDSIFLRQSSDSTLVLS